MSDSSILPPARLHPEAELARDALSTPVLSRAARLARWAGPETRVDAGGSLVEEQVPAAAAELGLTGEDAAADAGEAWRVAVDTGLVEVVDEREGTVAAGADLAVLTAGSPQDVLGVWLAALETVLADASVPDLDGLVDAIAAEGGSGELDLDALDWEPEAEAEFLDGVLGNLYLLTVGEEGPGGTMVPLPALAASVIVPGDMAEPTNDVLEQVSDAMMRLDDQFRMLEPVGLVEYRPVDEALMADADEEPAAPVDDTDVSRYGMVRLTPLGLYGLRARLLEAGFEAPAVGDLADKGADALLDGTAVFPPAAAHAETEHWLSRREPLAAARELLAAARGADEGAPLRRLRCQQALSLVGASAEPALREVLDDAELGGLARVWLAEHGARDVPPPSEAMIFWLTIDTVAAQLAAEGNSEELRSLVEGLASQHSGFFAAVWRVDHPATADVLEAMGRLHPDKKIAKEARKAAFKARSQSQHGG
ncbi:hypothetical protein [Streptomyces griseoloalbus]|uniref:Uncharacterized protein n=1 Tax=Streptomyces griseoloalbus TaxID=67303 RepID=A0A7W8BQE5_9ACTN|nr:hypothetical protein [Streptomyces albaduncus]MBB5126863.1 hypothetical protein [Streptomyces albaduncus]GGW78434.1 hypothetical protein GCM10010340_66190 [Streptomyces albaduncus]